MDWRGNRWSDRIETRISCRVVSKLVPESPKKSDTLACTTLIDKEVEGFDILLGFYLLINEIGSMLCRESVRCNVATMMAKKYNRLQPIHTVDFLGS